MKTWIKRTLAGVVGLVAFAAQASWSAPTWATARWPGRST